MTEDEHSSWRAYRRKHGPLDPVRRQAEAIASLCELVAAAAGNIKKKSGQAPTRDDFMPYLKPEPVADTVDNVAKLMRGEKV